MARSNESSSSSLVLADNVNTSQQMYELSRCIQVPGKHCSSLIYSCFSTVELMLFDPNIIISQLVGWSLGGVRWLWMGINRRFFCCNREEKKKKKSPKSSQLCGSTYFSQFFIDSLQSLHSFPCKLFLLRLKFIESRIPDHNNHVVSSCSACIMLLLLPHNCVQ